VAEHLELWGVAQIAEALQVTPRTVHNWRRRDDFPRPVARVGGTHAWHARDVRGWRRRDVKRQRQAQTF
jgi:predicted DNA-binding transcriptional regulator AlpA